MCIDFTIYLIKDNLDITKHTEFTNIHNHCELVLNEINFLFYFNSLIINSIYLAALQ
jgi:hypothetical protein